MFCSECGTRVRDKAKFCHNCGHRVEESFQESCGLEDISNISILDGTQHSADNSHSQLKNDRSKIMKILDLIVEDPSISEKAKIRMIINLTALTCAIVAVQPIPFADVFILTPIQVAMVTTMSRVMGRPVGKHGAGEMLASILGVLGWGVLAQQTILGLYKTIIPYAGGLTTIPLVYSATVGLGYAAKAILDARRRDQNVTKEQIQKIRKEAQDRARSEKRDWSLKAVKEEYRKIIASSQEYAQYQARIKANEVQALKNELERLAGQKNSLELSITGLSDELQNTQEKLKSSIPEDDYYELLEERDRIETRSRMITNEKEKLEQEICALEQRMENAARKSSEVIENRFRKCYPSLKVRHKRLFRRLGTMTFDQVHAIEVQMGRLQHNPSSVRWRHKIAGTDVMEIGCDGDLRLYVSLQDSGYVIEEVGDKLTQDADIKRLKKQAIV